jgi:hypothetical protein
MCVPHSTLPFTSMPILISAPSTASSFPSSHFRGSIPSTFRLTACLLAVLRLKLCVATQPPRTHSPVAGLPSGTGFPPAGFYTTLPGRTEGLTLCFSLISFLWIVPYYHTLLIPDWSRTYSTTCKHITHIRNIADIP